MKANELRIGNWIKHGESPSTFEYPGTLFQVSIELFFEMARSRISEYHLEPIPLTPEILEKCGFEKGYTDDKELYYTLELSPDIYCDLCLISGIETKYTIVKLLPYDRNFKFKYLHQLQNLFYALTGEELKVELKEKASV